MSETGENIAPLIPFKQNERRDTEAREPSELTDDESISLALSAWRHQSLPAQEVAQHISDLVMPGRDDAWNERLKNAMMNINAPDEVYEQLLQDPESVFAQMQEFLHKTKKGPYQERYAHERRATLRLMDMYELATALELASDPRDGPLPFNTHDVSEIFEKMTKGLDEAFHAS